MADAPQQTASTDWATALHTFLEPLAVHKDARPGLAGDIASYVLGGEPVAVLDEVAGAQCVGEALGQSGYAQRSAAAVAALYAGFGTLPAALALRWAMVLDAAARALGKSHCCVSYPGGMQWPELLMMHSASYGITYWMSQDPKVRHLSASQLEAMLVAAGADPAALLIGAFSPPTSGAAWAHRLPLMTGLIGYPEYVHKHLEAIRPLLRAPGAALRLQMLSLLPAAEPATLAALAPELSVLATASSKQVRAAAEPLIGKGGPAMRSCLQELAAGGTPEQRLHALRLLWGMAQASADLDLQQSLRATAGADKALSVQALLKEWDAAGDPDPSTDEHAVPTIDWSSGNSKAVDDALHVFRDAVNEQFERANADTRAHHALLAARGHGGDPHRIPLFGGDEFERLRAYMASDSARLAGPPSYLGAHMHDINAAVAQFAVSPGVTPVALLKLTAFADGPQRGNSLYFHTVTPFNAMHRASGKPSLLELQQLLEARDCSAEAVLNSFCDSWGAVARDWSAEAVWPFFAHHIGLLNQRLALVTVGDYSFNRSHLYRAVGMLPNIPGSTVDTLFALALGSAKTERQAAQDALAALPGIASRIIAALASGKAEVRAVAAQWLARIDHHAALPALEEAVGKEKNDVAKGAMLDALTKFGQPVAKYFDRGALVREAGKGLAKGVPKEIAWFPWDAMPSVRWADTGAEVEREVLRFLLAQAARQKSPAPNAVLRFFCAMFEADDRERFGQFVLEAWIAEDTVPISREQAEASARASATDMHGMLQSMPQYFPGSPLLGRSVDEIYARYLPDYLVLPAGSAIASKGVLAVAAACAGKQAAATTGRYLKQFYGNRAAHGKALIAMLAWVEHPAATQLVLSVGNRFRTKSFQEEATVQAQALAERKGWTIAELADRTMPAAGFDEGGELELDFGPRKFVARLRPDFKVELFNGAGEAVAALPEPRMDDNAELAKAAKMAFSAAKKELKGIVKAQTERLYEALCIERDWAFEDWERYLMGHPVVRHLAQRLVWVHYEAGGVVASFRPLDDGSLSDLDDSELSLPPDARVRLAHDSIMDGAVGSAWIKHMLDYEVLPLFQQFGRGSYSLPTGAGASDAVKDFEGHLLDNFVLRARAVQLGYTRGPTEDGGWFYSYEKRFSTLGLVARIAFTGSPMPETNRKVALLSLAFEMAGRQDGRSQNVGLGKVPVVLLSECYNDLRVIAEAGSGFDAEWRKKTDY